MADLGFLFDAAAHQAMSNLSVALDLARQGIPVFPCHPGGEKVKQPLQGVFWRTAATTDERRVARWWEQHPDALPAINLERADLIVIDCDGAGGIEDWDKICSGRPDSASIVETPSGGEHRYFKRGGRPLGNGRGSLPAKRGHDGIDVRGAGGYVIAPGATLLDGRRYEPNGYDILSAPEIPDWLISILQAPTFHDEPAEAVRFDPGPPVSDERKRAYGERALDEEMRELATAPPGTRNETANVSAFRIGQLVGGGCLTESEAYAALHNAALSWGISGKDKALGPKGTIARAIRDGARSPRYCPEAPDEARGSEIAAALLTRQVITAPNGELMDPATGEFIVPERIQADAAKDYPEDALQLPGLIGEMADWIMATAMFPCRLFAVSAALAAVGTVIGRQCYTGVPRAGSALYWLAIAPTAGGKDRPQEAIKQMFALAGLGHLIKPSVSSSAKLGMSLHEQPVQCQVIDEVGKVLRKFVSRNASSQEMALLDDYCSVWGKNLGSFEPEGVTTRGDTSIRQPSLTFFGATTPTNFYSQLRSAQVAGGFLNRFLVMQRHVRVPENPDVQPEEIVPPHFIEALQMLRTWQDARIMPAPGNMADDAERPPAPFVVPMTPDAEAILTEARARARAMILASDEDPVLEVYARSAEMVKRMALVLACGRHWRNMPACRIEVQDVTFAANLVDWSMASFVEGLRQHMAENENQANAKMVMAMVRKAGKMTRNELVRRVDGRLDARTLDNVMRSLVEGGTVEQCTEAASAKGGRPRTTYVYRGSGNLGS